MAWSRTSMEGGSPAGRGSPVATRTHRPYELSGIVGTVFQEPADALRHTLDHG